MQKYDPNICPNCGFDLSKVNLKDVATKGHHKDVGLFFIASAALVLIAFAAVYVLFYHK